MGRAVGVRTVGLSAFGVQGFFFVGFFFRRLNSLNGVLLRMWAALQGFRMVWGFGSRVYEVLNDLWSVPCCILKTRALWKGIPEGTHSLLGI